MEENLDLLARRVPSFAQGKRVLLVDRDASSLMNIASVLESHSYKVATIELESVAMSMFSEHKDEFDAVMVDMNMKDMTSLDFVRGILLTKSYTPIILMSSTGAEAMVSQALINGACHFLEKPIPNDQLRQIWQHVHRMRKLSEDKDAVSGSIRTSISEGATIKEKGIEPKKSAGIQIRELGINDCRRVIDPKGKNKQVEGEVGQEILNFKLPIGLTMDGIDELRMEANERGGISSRKRSIINDDDFNGERRKYQRNECSELPSHSRGTSPRGGENGSVRNRKTSTYEEKQSNIEFTAGICGLGQDMGIRNLTQCRNPSHLQPYKTQVQSMSKSRENAKTSLLSYGNASTFNIMSSGRGGPQSISHDRQGSVGLRLGDGWIPRPSQNFPTHQYGWPNPIPFTSLSHGRDLVPDMSPFAYAPNTYLPQLPLAQAGRSANPDPSTGGHVALDEDGLEFLTEWLRNPLDQDNPHIHPFDDGSHL